MVPYKYHQLILNTTLPLLPSLSQRKGGSASTASLGVGIVNHGKATFDQVVYEIDGSALDEVQRHLIDNNLGAVLLEDPADRFFQKSDVKISVLLILAPLGQLTCRLHSIDRHQE